MRDRTDGPGCCSGREDWDDSFPQGSGRRGTCYRGSSPFRTCNPASPSRFPEGLSGSSFLDRNPESLLFIGFSVNYCCDELSMTPRP